MSLARALRALVGGAAAIALAAAAFAKSPGISGQWSGEYVCAQGLTGVTLDVRERGGGKLDAMFVFYAHPNNPGVASGCFRAHGSLSRETGELRLDPSAWILQPSPDWYMVSVEGLIEPGGRDFVGRMIFPDFPSDCTSITLRRGAKPFQPPPKECTMAQMIS